VTEAVRNYTREHLILANRAWAFLLLGKLLKLDNDYEEFSSLYKLGTISLHIVQRVSKSLSSVRETPKRSWHALHTS
jgi:hypothetical protein